MAITWHTNFAQTPALRGPTCYKRRRGLAIQGRISLGPTVLAPFSIGTCELWRGRSRWCVSSGISPGSANETPCLGCWGTKNLDFLLNQCLAGQTGSYPVDERTRKCHVRLADPVE